MERILENLPLLTWQHYLFAAAVAYVITYIYRVFSRVAAKHKELKKNGEKTCKNIKKAGRLNPAFRFLGIVLKGINGE